MAIRLRRVDGFLIAVCAARTVHQPGDLYLDDEAHQALASKFGQDFNNEGFGDYPEDEAHNLLRDLEESNNENDDWWQTVYGTKH
jgi:hypothetical protein